MEITATSILAIALFIEAVVQAAKPIWNEEAKKLSIPELVSMGVGILIAVLAKVNLLEGLIVTESLVLLYFLYALSGIALGRGPSFVHDLWQKIRTFDADKAAQSATEISKIAETVTRIIQSLIGKKDEKAESEPDVKL